MKNKIKLSKFFNSLDKREYLFIVKFLKERGLISDHFVERQNGNKKVRVVTLEEMKKIISYINNLDLEKQSYTATKNFKKIKTLVKNIKLNSV